MLSVFIANAQTEDTGDQLKIGLGAGANLSEHMG